MDHGQVLHRMTRLRAGEEVWIDFLGPLMSVCLAAEAFRQPQPLNVKLAPNAQAYAATIGLTGALERKDPSPAMGVLCGQSYSPLEWLATHEEVDRCNERIGEVLRRCLDDVRYRAVGKPLVKVIGELHDNVASHAQGRGFSAAQVYARPFYGTVPCARFAIADNGRGFLRSARIVDRSIVEDEQAIRWAFERGNTSAREHDDWEQRGPWEAEIGGGAAYGDHHFGEGLAELADLVDRAHGAVWVGSGDGHLRYRKGAWRLATHPGFQWEGVAIELEIPLDAPGR